MNKAIRHTFHYAAKPEAIVDALTDAKHIRLWWTKDTVMTGGRLVVEFKGPEFDNVMVTVELVVEKATTKQVTWKCIKSNMQNTTAWENSTITFTLFPDNYGTRMEFEHSDYEDSPCFDVCFVGWHYFLGGSLKAYLETGKGTPYRVCPE